MGTDWPVNSTASHQRCTICKSCDSAGRLDDLVIRPNCGETNPSSSVRSIEDAGLNKNPGGGKAGGSRPIVSADVGPQVETTRGKFHIRQTGLPDRLGKHLQSVAVSIPLLGDV